MSVNINYKPPTNIQKWKTLQNGAFAIIEGNEPHPVPKGLYRIFLTNNEEMTGLIFILLPLFDGPFPDNMFPYMMPDGDNLPTIINNVSQIHIDVELV
jgi:hypothetical protein